MGVSGGPRSSVVARSRERTPRGVAASECKGRVEPRGCALGRRVSGALSGRGGWGEGCEWCAGGQRAAPGEWCGRAG